MADPDAQISGGGGGGGSPGPSPGSATGEGSVLGLFNPVIPTQIFAQSRNPEDYFRCPHRAPTQSIYVSDVISVLYVPFASSQAVYR